MEEISSPEKIVSNEQSEKKTEKKDKINVILPMTIRMVQQLAVNNDQNILSIDNVNFDVVSIVARIVHCQKDKVRIAFDLADSTGELSAYIICSQNQEPSFWKQLDYTQMQVEKMQYVRVMLYCRKQQQQNQYAIYYMEKITDFRQITRHYLDVIYRNCQRKKGYVYFRKNRSEYKGEKSDLKLQKLSPSQIQLNTKSSIYEFMEKTWKENKQKPITLDQIKQQFNQLDNKQIIHDIEELMNEDKLFKFKEFSWCLQSID